MRELILALLMLSVTTSSQAGFDRDNSFLDKLNIDTLFETVSIKKPELVVNFVCAHKKSIDAIYRGCSDLRKQKLRQQKEGKTESSRGMSFKAVDAKTVRANIINDKKVVLARLDQFSFFAKRGVNDLNDQIKNDRRIFKKQFYRVARYVLNNNVIPELKELSTRVSKGDLQDYAYCQKKIRSVQKTANYIEKSFMEQGGCE